MCPRCKKEPIARDRKRCEPCLAKARVSQKRYTERLGRDGVRAKNLKNSYGITQEDYDRILEKQGGVCAICGSPSNYYKGGRLCPLAVDHNHETRKVRGVLCNHCNRAIGMLKDDAEIVDRAAAYLRKGLG